MRISELKGEAALDFLADIIEPASKIMTDPEVKKLTEERNRVAIIKKLIKNYKPEIIEILAALDGVPADKYEINVFTLPVKIIELINDKELLSFFTSQVSMEDQTSSIEPMENTEEKDQ